MNPVHGCKITFPKTAACVVAMLRRFQRLRTAIAFGVCVLLRIVTVSALRITLERPINVTDALSGSSPDNKT